MQETDNYILPIVQGFVKMVLKYNCQCSVDFLNKLQYKMVMVRTLKPSRIQCNFAKNSVSEIHWVISVLKIKAYYLLNKHFKV